jgi:hypothetical protein
VGGKIHKWVSKFGKFGRFTSIRFVNVHSFVGVALVVADEVE